MRVETIAGGERSVHRISGQLTFEHHAALQAYLHLQTDAAPARGHIVELFEVEQADAAGFGFLLLLARRLAGQGQVVEMRGARGEVRRFLDLAHLERAAPIRLVD